MGTNFNVGSFNAINTSEEKKPKSNKSHGSNDELRKRLLLFGGVVLGGAILLFLILFLLSLFMQKTYSYDDIEKIMTNAAKEYFEDHPKKLPSSANQRVEIDVDTLVSYEYMDEMVEYTGEELTCTGKVAVQSNGSEYLYIPRLECGDDYVTQSLNEVVTKKVVTEGDGLYQLGNNYVYRGENVNNYLQLEQSLWRIVKVTEDGELMLILDAPTFESVTWDDRYNSVVGYNLGINTYSASRIRDSLETYYKTNDEDNAILSDDDRSKTVSFDLCIGKRKTTDTLKDNSLECSEVLQDQKIGLLTVSDYMTASLDSNCKTTVDYSCQNYNYLVSSYKWWLVTASSENTSEAYSISTSGILENTTTSSYMYPRAVIMLDSNVLFKSGKGTESKPYKVK